MLDSLKNIFGSFAPNTKRKSAYACVLSLFKKLNVDSADDEETDEYYTCHFDYQGAHFTLYASKKTSDVVVRFPWFMEAEEKYRPLVSTIVNNMNVDYLDYVFMHTFYAQENKVGVHMKTQFELYDLSDRTISMFKARMSTSFNMQRIFVEEYEKGKVNYTKEMRQNIYETLDQDQRENFLLLENEAMFHSRSVLHVSKNLVLSELLDHIPYREQMSNITNLRFVSPDKLIVVEEEKAIRKFDLREALSVPNSDEFLLYAQVLLRYGQSNVTIDFNREAHSQGKVVYYSVTLFDSWRFQKNTDEVPKPTHCMIAFDLMSSEELQAEVKFMRDDAQDKIQEGKLDQLTQAQRLMKEFAEWRVSDDIYWGERYALDNRYVEAITHYENALSALNPIFFRLDKRKRNAVYDIYYRLGFCYASLDNYPKALYYLDIPFQVGSMRASIEYINCLVNAKDIRSYSVISRQLEMVNESMAEEDDDDEEEGEGSHTSTDSLDYYYKFLLRRKAYVLIENKDFDQAEPLLQSMLKMEDPDMTDFALAELSYIENRRKQQQEKEQQEKESQEGDETPKKDGEGQS